MGYTRSIKADTRRELYAKSGNICAMYECDNPLIYENSANISEICHIEAVNDNGARYNPNSNNEYINSYENLVLLCPSCHKKVDAKQNEKLYHVDYLKRMKMQHETRVHEAILQKSVFEMPIIINDIDFSNVVNKYNSENENQINQNVVKKVIEETLGIQIALRSILYGIVEFSIENKTDNINMQIVWRKSNIDEYNMANILENLTCMGYIDEVKYIGEYESMVEDENGDVYFMNNNYLFKLVNGNWFINDSTKVLKYIQIDMGDKINFYNFLVNKDISILQK